MRQSTERKVPTAEGTVVDSLRLVTGRILVRRLKLGADNDSAGKDIKTEPFILTFTWQQLMTTATIRAARSVDRRFHRLSNDEADRYANPAFADFTPPERYSVIIEGRSLDARDTCNLITSPIEAPLQPMSPQKLDPLQLREWRPRAHSPVGDAL